MKINAAVFGGLFLAGLLCADFLKNAGSFEMTTSDLAVLSLEIIWARTKLFVFVWLASLTKIKKAVAAGIKAFMGFAAGFFLLCCIRALGLKGILFYLAALLPHWALYVTALVLILTGGRYRIKNSQKQKLKVIARYLGICLVILLGCLIEALMNYYALAFISAMS